MRELYAIPSEHLILAGLKVDNHYLYPAYNTRGEVRINTLGSTSVEQQYLSYFSDVNKEDDYLWWNRKNFIYFGCQKKYFCYFKNAWSWKFTGRFCYFGRGTYQGLFKRAFYDVCKY